MPQRGRAQNSTTTHAREGPHPGGAGDRTPMPNGKVETSDRGGRAEIGIQVLRNFSILRNHHKTTKMMKKITNTTKQLEKICFTITMVGGY